MPTYLYPIPNLVNITFSSFENSVLECDSKYASNNTIVCDDSDECRFGVDSSNVSLVDRNGPICCTSVWGCGERPNISTSSNIRCDAMASCRDIVDSIETKSLNGNGSMYYAGFFHQVLVNIQ